MLGLKPAIGGFTTFAGHGHGLDFATASIGELVRGHVERGVLMAVMPKSRASEVLETIRQKLPIPHMAYWLEPVLDLGRLAAGIPE